ncbi:MAG TPA: ABZJ_00895 family protein [Alphaproteobacteria bacterium]|nr:ABZJ_00895 family protein [Alphaproteobacteria bacterium]
MTGEINLYRYGLIFMAVYAVIILLANVVLSFIDAEVGSGLNIGILIGSVTAVSYKFAVDQGRKPVRKEKLLISLFCLIGAFAVSLIGALIVSGIQNISISDILQGYSPTLLAISMVIVSIIYYGMIYLTFGWFVSINLKNLNKRKSK